MGSAGQSMELQVLCLNAVHAELIDYIGQSSIGGLLSLARLACTCVRLEREWKHTCAMSLHASVLNITSGQAARCATWLARS